jgi:hypothetical protein
MLRRIENWEEKRWRGKKKWWMNGLRQQRRLADERLEKMKMR